MDKNLKIIGQYKNGNYWVYLFSDGTKIRYTEENELKPEFPECIDLCITKKCDIGCQFCYENCTPAGKSWDFLKNKEWLSTLNEYTEISINGNVLNHIPNLNEFFLYMLHKHVIVNATFNAEQYFSQAVSIRDHQTNHYIHGVGISINKVYSPDTLKSIHNCNNAVIHVVAGLFDKDIYQSLIDAQNILLEKFSINYKYKLLILGYKNIGRGKLYKHLYPDSVNENIKWLSDNIEKVMDSFEIVTFDNLALMQLDMKNKVSEEIWKQCYMGDDGEYTMYIDGVAGKYALNSVTPENLRYNVTDNIKTMFDVVKRERDNLNVYPEQNF